MTPDLDTPRLLWDILNNMWKIQHLERSPCTRRRRVQPVFLLLLLCLTALAGEPARSGSGDPLDLAAHAVLRTGAAIFQVSVASARETADTSGAADARANYLSGPGQAFKLPWPLAEGSAASPSPDAANLPVPASLPSPRVDLSLAPDGAGPGPADWSLREFTGKARVRVERVGSLYAVRLRSESASFTLYKDVTVDATQFPYLSWVWRVDQLPPNGDARQRDTDDQAAQLYVVFPRFPELVRSQIIGYIWDSGAPAGSSMNSPTDRKVKYVVVRSGGDRLGQWILESRNLLEDYKKLYGGDPPKVGRIALLINSQRTKSTAVSWFASMVFTQIPVQREVGASAIGPALPVERAPGLGALDRVGGGPS